MSRWPFAALAAWVALSGFTLGEGVATGRPVLVIAGAGLSAGLWLAILTRWRRR